MDPGFGQEVGRQTLRLMLVLAVCGAITGAAVVGFFWWLS